METIKLYYDILQELNNKNFFVNTMYLPNFFDDLVDLFNNMVSNPKKFVQYQKEYVEKYLNIINSLDSSQCSTCYTEKETTNFSREWEESIVLKLYNQLYQLNKTWTSSIIANFSQNMSPQKAQRLRIMSKFILDAMSPNNIPYMNPQVINEYYKTKGRNIVQGMNNFLRDLKNSKNCFSITKSYQDSCNLGKNIAPSKGFIVFENDIMQLIQYNSLNSRNYSVPILIVPPWINKFYIFDLNKKESFIQWLLEKGYSVFIISWVNPTEVHSTKGFDDYMIDGPLAAIKFILRSTNQNDVNIMGYCISGTMLAAFLSYAKTSQFFHIRSATFLTTLIDFSNPGSLSAFITKEQIEYVEYLMYSRGFLEGSEINNVFNIMRANDTIWYFVINKYLLGKECEVHDILRWSSDSTRLTASLHSFCLRNIFYDNLLTVPNKISIKGVPIDISKIDIPVCFIAAKRDHITPWESVYNSFLLLKNSIEKKFILTDGGHVAGIINHPSKNKYCYWHRNDIYDCSEQWFNNAQQSSGSWWNEWHQWNLQFSGNLTDSYTIKRTIEPAPGRYVLQK